MTFPDPESLAIQIARMQRWLDTADQNPAVTLHYFDHAFAAVTVDPTSDAPAASLNRNAIRLCGGRGLTESDLCEMARLFEARAVERFFIWLYPGPGMEVVRGWLAAIGAVKVPWTRYPTMVHTGELRRQPSTNLEVRKVSVADIEKHGLAEHGAHYVRSIGRPGFHHFAAFEGDQAIAIAMLVHFEDIGYVAGAHTAERFRRRGAQTALIAARIEEARRLDCKLIVTDTLTMLEHSYSNLLRAGFEVVYEREVYECTGSLLISWAAGTSTRDSC
jgi:GNAT superfamily N-acetyltransferase